MPGSSTYITKDGDMLDWICWRHYGRSGGTTETVLEANPHLAFEPARLSSGLVVVLPEIDPPVVTGRIRLWE